MVYHIHQRRPDGNSPQKTRDARSIDTNKLDLRNEIQEEYRTNPIPWLVWVFQCLDIPQNSRVLEIGSGTGTLWRENAHHLAGGIPGSWNIFLSDHSLDMMRKAQANLSSIGSGMDFLNLDGQELPFPKERFDAVLAVGVLDLLDDLNLALSDMWRVLRPSGQLIATAGGKGHLQELENLLRPFLPTGTAETLGGDVRRFGMETGGELLSHYFEEVVRHDYIDRLVFTRMDPILNYVLSEQAIAWSIPLSQLGEFVRSIQQSLDKHGEITVTVRKGLFVARKKVIGE